MTRATVLFHRLARREYAKDLRWYARRSRRAALGFAAAVDEAVQRTATAPDQGAPYQGSSRWVRTRRYPYVLYYRIIDPARVLVMAVAHAGRRPGYWMRRRP
jgi:plasmid stabilization system protein ParE